jgi:predicted acylesterase/phospholipase RssA
MTVTLGGGGAYALGFNLGIARGLQMSGIDISKVPLMGTSGGAHSAVAIATGMTFDEVAEIWQPYVDACGPVWVKALPLADELYGSRAIPEGGAAAGVAIRLLGFKREALWAADHPLPVIVAASASIAPFVRPTKVGKRRYIDGGFKSNTSGDLAPDADVNLILAPFAFKSQGFVGRTASRHLAKEPGKWEARTGGHAVVVRPSDAMVAVRIKGMKAMGDTHLGRQIHDLAIEIGVQLAGTLRRDHPEMITALPI